MLALRYIFLKYYIILKLGESVADASLLLSALRLNAWFSGVSALFLLLAAPWVGASLVLVVLFYPALTTVGLVLVDLVALAVLFFAIQQIRGLRALPG